VSRRLLCLLAGLTLLGCLFSASASGAARFYTPNYGSMPEVIGGFDLGADGSLAPIPGSPFPATSAGFGGLLDLAFTPDGTRALSGYFFTGGIQPYRVAANGSIELAGGVVPPPRSRSPRTGASPSSRPGNSKRNRQKASAGSRSMPTGP
jgi:hypothetical protein